MECILLRKKKGFREERRISRFFSILHFSPVHGGKKEYNLLYFSSKEKE